MTAAEAIAAARSCSTTASARSSSPAVSDISISSPPSLRIATLSGEVSPLGCCLRASSKPIWGTVMVNSSTGASGAESGREADDKRDRLQKEILREQVAYLI